MSAGWVLEKRPEDERSTLGWCAPFEMAKKAPGEILGPAGNLHVPKRRSFRAKFGGLRPRGRGGRVRRALLRVAAGRGENTPRRPRDMVWHDFCTPAHCGSWWRARPGRRRAMPPSRPALHGGSEGIAPLRPGLPPHLVLGIPSCRSSRSRPPWPSPGRNHSRASRNVPWGSFASTGPGPRHGGLVERWRHEKNLTPCSRMLGKIFPGLVGY